MDRVLKIVDTIWAGLVGVIIVSKFSAPGFLTAAVLMIAVGMDWQLAVPVVVLCWFLSSASHIIVGTVTHPDE